jgi:signal transduction histidine kinase
MPLADTAAPAVSSSPAALGSPRPDPSAETAAGAWTPVPASIPLGPERADPEQEALFNRELMLARARHAAHIPVPVILVTLIVALIVWKHGPPVTLIAAWFMAVMAVLAVRTVLMRRALRAPMPEEPAMQRAANTVAFVNGAFTGLCAPLFFPYLTLEWRAALTMVLVSWSAGAIPVSSASPRPFALYVGPLLLQLGASWALMGGGADGSAFGLSTITVLVGLAICALFGLQLKFVSDSACTYRESFFIRYHNRQLIGELERQREAVVRERDRAQEANRAKSRFLAAASHDLRQPLHSVSVFSAALSLRALDDRTRELADNLSLGINALSSLLDGLLDVSRLDADTVKPERTVFAVESALHAIAGEFAVVASGKGLTLEVQAESGLFVQNDRFLLERVLRNLLDNAVKYTTQGGIVLRSYAMGTDALTLAVIDTGIGIAPHEAERIFEEFYQVANPGRDRSHGLGLGLPIVKRLVGLLGVSLRMESRLGEGTTFTIAMRRAPAPATVEQPAERTVYDADLDRLPIGLRVLVVDDEASIRVGMADLFAEWGVIADTAGTIEDALRSFERDRPHVLIADYRLRGDESGASLVRTLQARDPGLTAIVITGDTSPDRLREVNTLGVTLLHKPVRPAELRRTLIALLDSERA